MTDNNYLIDHGDWIALRADETEDPDSEFVGIYPSDYLSAEHFAGYSHLGNVLKEDNGGYGGQERLSIIQRDSDQATFGFEYWFSGGKHGEDYAEANPETVDYDFPQEDEDEYPVWCVFKPVKPHSIPTYRFTKDTDTNDL